YHGSIELRDDESLLGSIALEMPTIVVNLIARDKESNPPDDDLTHVSEPSSFPVNPKLPDDLKVRITEFSTWAKQYDKPGALLLLKLIVAAGQTLDTYGQTLSPAQAEIVLNLFEGLQEILVEREEGSKKRAVRVDSLVTLILDALKPVTPKPETKGRKALEGLDDKVSELERRIDEFVMETNELGSLRRHAAGLEVEDGELQPALKQAEEELETARKDLAETTIRLRAGSVGDGDFARTLGELNEKNVVFETKKVAHEGVKAKRDAIGNRWAEANLAIDKLSEKIRLLEELRQQYDRLITLIDHL
ncbi:MAG TPA: hypothetical protein VI588_02665, partial [Candidatus Gracilibacteria bacterium]|nr:hypothetical protein [Candidatus Gracilibacteria bacterium]